MQSKEHWENVYTTKAADEVSWFQEHAALSLKLIREAGVPVTASIIDVGGGASTLVDDLFGYGYENVTVLDLSGKALATAKARLSTLAVKVQWLEANIIETKLESNAYDVWHDRAVFHFLTTAEERHAMSKLCLGRLNQAAWSSWQPLQRMGQVSAVACLSCAMMPMSFMLNSVSHLSCLDMKKSLTIRQGAMSRSLFTVFVAR
jgi:SAM-dependent methyltransferase